MVEYNPRSIDQMYEQYGRVQSSRAAKFNKSPLDDNTSSGFGGMGPDPEAKAKGLGSPTNQTSKKDDDDDKEVGGIGRLFSKFFGAAESAGLEFKKLDRPKPSIYDRDDMKPIDIDAMDKRIDDAVNFDLANPLPSMNFKDDEYAASTYDEVQPLEGADTYKARRTTAQGINDTIKGLMDTEQRQTDIRQAVNKTIESLKSADANVPYVIQAGDTLSDIAAKTGTTVQDLVKTNNIKDKNKIYTGNELIVPTDKTTKTKEEIVNNLVENYEIRITTRGDEDPQRQFNQSGVPMDQRDFAPEDTTGFGGMGPDPSTGQSITKGLMSKADDDMGLPYTRSDTEQIIALEPMFKFIEKGEGDYNSSNRGTIGKNIKGSTNNTIRDGKKLTEMTIGEIKEKQEITDPNNPERLYAVGRFQAIPTTLDMAIDDLALSDDTVFNEDTQDKIGKYLITKKRKKVGEYLEGNNSVSQDEAMLQLAKEFASFPVPKDMTIKRGGKTVKLKKGDSYYGNGNKAQHTFEEVEEELDKLRGNM